MALEAEYEHSAVPDDQATPRPQRRTVSAKCNREKDQATERDKNCTTGVAGGVRSDDSDPNDADVDESDADEEGHKRGRYKKEELAELDTWGQFVLAEARTKAHRMGRSPEQILERALHSVKFGRKENRFALFKHWYSVMHKHEEIGMSTILPS